MPATKRKFEMLRRDAPSGADPEDAASMFTLLQMNIVNTLLCKTGCTSCSCSGVRIEQSTKLGPAVKLDLVCVHCGVVASAWSSSRQADSNAFEVNLRAMAAMKGIRKGQAALNDFWATMNVSHRGLQHRTYQGHLKKTFRKPSQMA